MMSKYYPIFIDIDDHPVLVAGGGMVAWRKVQTLLDYGALVYIVSPHLIPELAALVDQQRCFWLSKEYSTADLNDAVLVFSCTEKEEVNAQVAQDAKRAYRPVNVVDDPEKCSFIVPSILQRGDLCIAVSTGGSSPIVARQIREELEQNYGDEIAAYLALLREWRNEIKHRLPPAKRRVFWDKVTAPEVRGLVKAKRLSEVKGVIEECFRSLLD